MALTLAACKLRLIRNNTDVDPVECSPRLNGGMSVHAVWSCFAKVIPKNDSLFDIFADAFGTMFSLCEALHYREMVGTDSTFSEVVSF